MTSHAEQLTPQQRAACGLNAEAFLFVVADARYAAERDGGQRLREAHDESWSGASYRHRLRQANELHDAGERAWGEALEADRHGRGTVAWLLEELTAISPAADDAALAVLVRDLIDPADYDLLTRAWRSCNLPLPAPTDEELARTVLARLDEEPA